MSPNCRCTVAVWLALALSGCASPSLRPFADATEELRTIVLAEEAQLVEDARTLLQIGETTGTTGSAGYQGLKAVLDTFVRNRPATEPALDAAVSYAQALARISERAESGQDAVGRILGAADSVTAAFNTGAGLSAVDDAIRQPIEALFGAIARIDGQQQLLEIMVSTQQGDPKGSGVVPSFEKALSVVSTDVYAMLANAIGDNVTSILNTAFANPDIWFVNVSGTACARFYRDHLLDTSAAAAPAGASAEFAAECIPDSSQTLDERALRLELLEARTREVVTARETRSAVDAAVDAHLRFSSTLIETAGAWAAEHERVYRYLDRCGGLRVFSGRCGELHVDQFLEAIVDLEATVTGAEP